MIHYTTIFLDDILRIEAIAINNVSKGKGPISEGEISEDEQLTRIKHQYLF